MLLTKGGEGWNYPAFYTLASASFGLQIGLEQSELIVLVMNGKSASGAYAWVTVNGSVIKPRDSWNEAYYGHAESVADIVTKHAVSNPGADPLRQNLASIR